MSVRATSMPAARREARAPCRLTIISSIMRRRAEVVEQQRDPVAAPERQVVDEAGDHLLGQRVGRHQLAPLDARARRARPCRSRSRRRRARRSARRSPAASPRAPRRRCVRMLACALRTAASASSRIGARGAGGAGDLDHVEGAARCRGGPSSLGRPRRRRPPARCAPRCRRPRRARRPCRSS